MSLIEEFNSSDTLVIAATGYGRKLSLSAEDFFPRSGLEEASKIVISDDKKLKTLAGLPPDFPTFESLVAYLEKTIRKHNFRTTIITGTSGGGHTALLLGHLLKADYVVAFAPYPYLSIKEASKRNDPALHSMSRVVKKFDQLPTETKRYLDLRDTLINWNETTEYYVHVSKYNRLDYERSKYLSGIESINIIAHPFKSHAIAGSLNSSNLLKYCFNLPYRKTGLPRSICMHIKFFVSEAIGMVATLTKRIKRRARRALG